MKVLLINSEPFHVEQKPAIPLGLLSIATYLTQHGHNVQIYDRVIEGGNIKKHLISFSPDIVGISAIGIKSFPDAIKVSKAVKKKRIPVVWGGQISSLLPEIVLKTGVVDYVVMGEGEITMLSLLDAITNKTPLSDVDGLAYFEAGLIKTNRQRDFADLAQLPIIDWSFVNPKEYFIKDVSSKRTLHVYSSKGCPGHCTYCYSPEYSQCVWRARPSEYFLSEIKYLINTYGVDGVFFADDVLSPNKTYLNSLCGKIIESGLDFVWGCDMRIGTCDEEELRLMHDAGCKRIFFGIESGSEQRQIVIKKRTDLNKALETVDFCKKIGIVTTTSFIIGFPDETEEELKETVNYIKKLNSDIKLAFFYYPIPNSEMFEELVKSGNFTVPDTYREWLKFPKLNRLGKNFSQVPDRDLKVVSAWFLWASIFGKYRNNKTKSRALADKDFGQSLDAFKRGTLGSVITVFLAAKEFLEITLYTFIFPKIRKKYGLYKNQTNAK